MKRSLLGLLFFAASQTACWFSKPPKVKATALIMAGLMAPQLAYARARASGFCDNGGVQLSVTGFPAAVVTPKTLGSYPGCTVTVYATGTLNLSSIYSDNSGTSKANPFTADATTGAWFFYADNGRYDVRLSAGGIPTPFTLGDIPLMDPTGTLGNGTTVIDVASLTPYTANIDLAAATANAVAKCTATPACKYDYSGYAGHTLTWLTDPTWPNGSDIYAPAQTWTLPLNVSLILPSSGHLHGGSLGYNSSVGAALQIKKLNTTTDMTPAVLVADGAISIELDHVGILATTKAIEPSFALSSLSVSTNTDAVTSGWYVSGGTATGTAGQTCTVTFTGGAATATVPLNGTNVIGTGMPMTITAIGSGYGSAPTTGTLSNGSATCSGTATLFSFLGKGVANFSSSQSACAANACANRWGGVFGTTTLDGYGWIYASDANGLTFSTSGYGNITPTNNFPHMFAPFVSVNGGFGISNLPNSAWLFADNNFHDFATASDVGMAWFGSGCNCYNTVYNFTAGGTDTHGGFYKGGNSFSNNFGFMNLGATDEGPETYAAAFGYGFWDNGGGRDNYDHIDFEATKYSLIVDSGTLADHFKSIYYENTPGQFTSGNTQEVSFPVILGASYGNDLPCVQNMGVFVAPDTTALANTICSTSEGSRTGPYYNNYGSVSKPALSSLTVANQPVATCSGTCATSYQYYEVLQDNNASNCGGSATAAGCSTPITLTPVLNAASLSTTNYNVIQRINTILPGVKCYDILYPDTAHAIAKCVNAFITGFYDDGTHAGVAYTANTRDTTADQSSSGSVAVGTTTVGSLPAAASGNAGTIIRVSDSTAVAAEGQTCVGGSNNIALAFSNGTVWKCL